MVIRTADVDSHLRSNMHALFERYYDRADLALFDADLREKDTAITIWAAGELCGFTTLQSYLHSHGDRTIAVLFSGDTVMDRNYWGRHELASAWLKEIGRVSRRYPQTPLYWLLIVKGHRTYRYMPAFGIRFVPHWEARWQDVELIELRNALASSRFGDAFDAEAGIVRFSDRRNRLKPEIAWPTPRERRRPDVAFFLERNPGFAEGDELVCLCPLTSDNMRPYGRRLFEQGRGG